MFDKCENALPASSWKSLPRGCWLPNGGHIWKYIAKIHNENLLWENALILSTCVSVHCQHPQWSHLWENVSTYWTKVKMHRQKPQWSYMVENSCHLFSKEEHAVPGSSIISFGGKILHLVFECEKELPASLKQSFVNKKPVTFLQMWKCSYSLSNKITCGEKAATWYSSKRMHCQRSQEIPLVKKKESGHLVDRCGNALPAQPK